jgi:hypothetical protein
MQGGILYEGKNTKGKSTRKRQKESLKKRTVGKLKLTRVKKGLMDIKWPFR